MKLSVRLGSVLAIVCLGLLVYSNTFQASFHFDDQDFIVHNPFIRSLPQLFGHWQFYPTRLLVFLTLAVNYHFNGLNVFGYHLFNLAVHLGCAVLVWWLVLLTMTTPVMKDDPIIKHGAFIALGSALLFVSHPVQTEAVTYIWQRATSLVAFFYLASLCFYIKSRLSQGGKALFLYLFSLISALAAMFTKENAVTLPLAVLLYEFYFFEKGKAFNTKSSIFLLTILVIPVTLLWARSPQLAAIHQFTESKGGTSPLDYLLTQFRVMMTYIRLCFLPIHQNIDYDQPIARSLFEGPVFLSFLGLAALFYWAKHLFVRYRLISFAIFWFFLTQSLESSVLPLKNIIFEHRLYLPMAGYSLFLVGGGYYLLGKNHFKTLVVVLGAILAFNAFLAHQRNEVWRDELTLWNDAVVKSPHKARPYNNRAYAYLKQGRLPEALADYNKAISLDKTDTDAYVGRGLVFDAQGDFDKAIADYNTAIAVQPDAKAYNNRGIFYFHQGRWASAVADLTRAIALDPQNEKAYYNRGLSFAKQGRVRRAVADYNKAIALDGANADAYYNRGLAFAQEQYFNEAIFDFNRALEINPRNADAYNNRGIAYAMEGDLNKAVADFNKALTINPHDAQARNNLAHARALRGF
ncbi:MAG: tetratricopeptide repeat protein [Candidatus Omnitrophica bacterium]|nr:tetratricopeptide repeat protein [Candidatus Omnitrophota bacterium]MDE2222257.1 tetratricopeptide repeat protein [Candidatus Omnitrophota bacterium]